MERRMEIQGINKSLVVTEDHGEIKIKERKIQKKEP